MGEAFVKHDIYDILRNQSRPTSISARKLKYQILLFRGKPLKEIQPFQFTNKMFFSSIQNKTQKHISDLKPRLIFENSNFLEQLGIQTLKTNPSKVAFPAKCQKFVYFPVIGIGLNDSSSRLEETFLLQEKIENVCLHNEARHATQNAT